MRNVCICFSGFLETQEHSFICNCHLQLIIAWYVLYINDDTFYTCSLECGLSSSANTTTGNISKWTLVYLFGPKIACSSAKEMYTNTKSQHVCACTQAHSAVFQRYTAQTRTELASVFLTIVRLSNICVCTLVTVKKRRKGAQMQVFEHVSAYTGTNAGRVFRMLAPAARGAGGWESRVSIRSHASIPDLYGGSHTRSTLWEECIRMRVPPLLKCFLTCGTSSPCYRLECVLLKGCDMYLSAGL